jgi:DNA-binding CsgD family transcriptional regulator/tetratricopeptide (TPR) repeat protein
VGLVVATRAVIEPLAGVTEIRLDGLTLADARVLLDSALVGRLETAVRERFLAETHGNPLALLELPNALTPAEAATGILRQSGDSLSGRIEDSFKRRLEPLPDDTQRLLVLAAAEPLGDPLLLRRAASILGLAVEASDAAEEAGLLEIRERASFRHPLVRSAVYGAATQRDRRLAHGALANATDPNLDPDRKAWHRAQATAAPDEAVATELERTATRAKSRGGLRAAGVFLERAAMLTPDAGARAGRSLAAAEVMYEAGSFEAAESLLRAIDPAYLDEVQEARAERLRARISLSVGHDEKDATLRLLAAAARLSQSDPALGQATRLEALRTACYRAQPEVLAAVVDALDEPSGSTSGAPAELMVRGYAQLLKHGYPAGTELLREAMMVLRAQPELDETDLPILYWSIDTPARSLWDFDSWNVLARRGVELARESGALSMLAQVLCSWADVNVAAGDFAAAASALAEAEAVADVTHASPDWESAWLDAWRFDEAEALRRIDLEERRASDRPPQFEYARALVYNASARYEAALDAAQRACDRHPLGVHGWSLVELVEAAARCGQHERASVALEQLVARTQLGATDWALGLEARSTALLSKDSAVAEPLYREAVERLGRAGTRPDLARAQLVYGEWLRREGRRLDAREQLRAAYDTFSSVGAPVFAERARRELAGTGETARKRTDDTRADLTAQESQIARLASEGLTNPEIGAQLFLSPRTIEWHLRRVYPKLGISSRRELRTVLGSI